MFMYTKEVNSYLLAIQQGDKTQVTPLYEITANHLRGIALNYLFDKNDADDVVVETFIKIDKYIQSFQRGENGYNWMCTIAQNIAKTMNKNRLKATISEQKFTEYFCETEYYDKGIDNIEFLSQLTKLSEKDRLILFRWIYWDETQEQIGKKFGVSKVAINRRIQNIVKIVGNSKNK